MDRLILHEEPLSGNCYKIRLTAALLGIPLERRLYSILKGETRTAEFLQNVSSFGRVPVLQIGDATFLPESNAVCFYLAETTTAASSTSPQATALIPQDPMRRAEMLRWMFFEQNQHEVNIATLRFWIRIIGEQNLDESRRAQIEGKIKAGEQALDCMGEHLAKSGHGWFVGDSITLADICLFAYTHVAHDAGFKLAAGDDELLHDANLARSSTLSTMPQTVNCSQPQVAERVRLVERFKAATQKKTAAVRYWYDKKGQGCLRSVVESESEDPATQIEAFLTHVPVPEIRGSKQRQPEIHTQPSKAAQRKPEHAEFFLEIPYETGSVSSVSTMLDVLPRTSSSTISLPSTFSMGSITAPEPRAPQTSPPHPRPYHVIDTPDDFEQFRSRLRNQVELESISASLKEKSLPNTKCFTVDSTPIPVAEEWPNLQFKAYPGKQDTDNRNPVSFQAYSAGSKPKHGHVAYIPPTLQPGFVNGVPPVLRAAHNATNSTRNQEKPEGTATGHTGQNYSWPLVDFHKEIFLNADPSQTHLSTRYQEPRIPSMEFSGRGLEDEMNAVLDNFHNPVAEKEAVQLQDRAWMSPSSPLDPTAYEMEARIPVVPQKAVETCSHPRILTVGTQQKQESTMSAVSPAWSAGKRVTFTEYNWPRFSDDQFTDPAEEYSREYRRRRREARRERARPVD